MNRDDIYQTWGDLVRRHTRGGACNFQDAAKELAELVAAAEREACAKMANKYAKSNEENDNMVAAFVHLADAIRARGEHE